MPTLFHAKNLRKFHLYAGCFFTPVLVFFILSGCWQVFRLQDTPKEKGSTYQPPKILQVLSRVHLSSKVQGWTEKPSMPFKFFCLAMTFFLLSTIAIGIFLAFQVSRQSWLVWACFLLGTLIPILLLRFP